MPSAIVELQKAIHAALVTDEALVAAMGTVQLHDQVPPQTPFPYLAFGRASTRDHGDGTTEGIEHDFSIHVWSQARGRREAARLAHLVEARLHDAALTLDGHALVNLRATGCETRFDAAVPAHHVVLRLRAVTQAL